MRGKGSKGHRQPSVRPVAAWTLEEITEHILALRLQRDQADARLLLFLYDVESSAMEQIIDGGYSSFAQFAQQFVKPGRYESFKWGVEKIGPAAAEELGSEMTIQAAKLSNGSSAFVEEGRDWIAKNRRLPTKESAERLRRKIDPAPSVPKSHGYRSELAELRAENTRLQRENAALEAEVARLSKRLQKYEGKGRRGGAGAAALQ